MDTPYMIITGTSEMAVESKVNRYCKKGYMPTGGISMTQESLGFKTCDISSTKYAQAIYKPASPPLPPAGRTNKVFKG